MSSNKKTLIDGDFQVGSAHFYVDVENNRVGLNQVNPTSSLDVNGNAFIGTDMTVASNVTVGSNVIAQKFTGSAAGLTSVPADQISGVIPVENGGTGTTATTGTGSLVKSDNPTFTGTVTADTFSGSGASLTNIPMGQATGTLAVANGGTGVTTSTGTGNTVLSASPTLTGTVTAETGNFSSNVSASNIYAGYDTDVTSYLGRAAVGFSGISDEATFAHVDVNSTNNYALKQTATGGTYVNSATSKSTIFSINDSEQARINVTGLGVGTNDPLHKLDVHGTANVGALTCTTISGDGYLLSNVSGYSWPTHINGNDIYYTTGNVGIGTATPGNTLEVAGTASVAILKSAADAATSTYNYILNGPRPGTTSSGAIHFINGSTRTSDGGASTYTIRNDSGALRLGNASYNTLLEGNVGIGVTDPDSKLEVRGNIRASFSDTNHGMFIDAGGTILRDYGGNGAGFHFTTNAIWPTNYLGAYSAGGIDLGSSSYRWNNVYTEALNASGTVTATTFSGALSNNLTPGSYLTGNAYNGSTARTFSVDATTTNTASKIVARDSNGDIFGRYFHGSYMNMSHGAADRNSDTVFYSSTDNYIRKNTASGFRSSLNVPTRTGGDASGTWGISISGSASSLGTQSFINRVRPYSNSYGKGYNTAALEIREYNLESATGGTEWERAPRIGFHWAGRVASQILMDSGGTINIATNPGTGYERLRAGPIEALGEFFTNTMMRIQYNNPTINFQDTDHNAGFVHNNSNLLYILRGSNNATSWTSVNGQWPFIFNLSNNDATCGGNFTAVGNITAYSDIRHKRNIVKIEDSLNKVHKLSGYTYNRKDNGKRFTGLIAQEVQEVLPEAVNEDTKGELSVAYGNMTGLLVEAIKELTAQLNTERERVDVLSKKLGI